MRRWRPLGYPLFEAFISCVILTSLVVCLISRCDCRRMRESQTTSQFQGSNNEKSCVHLFTLRPTQEMRSAKPR